MRTLVVYDSVQGNTERIARAIGEVLPGEVQVLRVTQADARDLEAVDLLVIGSPTHGGGPTEAIQALLEKMGAPARVEARVATFDTRLAWRWIRLFGFAAPRMADALEARGWTLVGEPGGFFVGSKKIGPLKPGEVDRAAAWAKELAASLE